jgi:hypothetical protein
MADIYSFKYIINIQPGQMIPYINVSILHKAKNFPLPGRPDIPNANNRSPVRPDLFFAHKQDFFAIISQIPLSLQSKKIGLRSSVGRAADS